MIGRRSGRSSDGAGTVAKERGEGTVKRRGLWGVTSLNYPKGLPSVGGLTGFQSRVTVCSSTEEPKDELCLGGEVSNNKM